MTQDYTNRFSGRALAYAKYRPSYPKEKILDILRKEASFDSKKIVADIGSGTGILARIFLENGNVVFGVEPNDDMRGFAENDLSQRYAIFQSIKGTAENTTLKDHSVDFISTGQALHWFDPELSRKEFKRIISQNGHLCVIYNDRRSKDDEKYRMMRKYEAIAKKYSRDRPSVERVTGDRLRQFFEDWEFKEFTLDNEQVLDFEGLVGRLSSASYIPREGEEFYQMKQDLERVFNENQRNGKITMYYETKISLGAF